MEIVTDTLESEIKETESKLSKLKEAEGRKQNRVRCEVYEHITNCHQVVLGHDPSSPFIGGYQIHSCVVCGTWIAKDYTGREYREIDEESAKALIKGKSVAKSN